MSDGRSDKFRSWCTRRGGGVQLPEPMTAIVDAMHSGPIILMFVCFGFEVVEAYHLVFQEITSGPKNLLWLDNKHFGKLVTVARKPSGGVAGVPVAKLFKWNFKLLV